MKFNWQGAARELARQGSALMYDYADRARQEETDRQDAETQRQLTLISAGVTGDPTAQKYIKDTYGIELQPVAGVTDAQDSNLSALLQAGGKMNPRQQKQYYAQLNALMQGRAHQKSALADKILGHKLDTQAAIEKFKAMSPLEQQAAIEKEKALAPIKQQNDMAAFSAMTPLQAARSAAEAQARMGVETSPAAIEAERKKAAARAEAEMGVTGTTKADKQKLSVFNQAQRWVDSANNGKVPSDTAISEQNNILKKYGLQIAKEADGFFYVQDTDNPAPAPQPQPFSSEAARKKYGY